MLRKLEESLNILTRDIDHTKMTEIKFLELRTQTKTSDTMTIFLPLPPQYSSLDPEFDPSSQILSTSLILKLPGE